MTETDLWAEIAEFLLNLQRHPQFKPETVTEIEKTLETIPAIRNVIRSIDDDEKYIQMLMLADENEELLSETLKELLDDQRKL